MPNGPRLEIETQVMRLRKADAPFETQVASYLTALLDTGRVAVGTSEAATAAGYLMAKAGVKSVRSTSKFLREVYLFTL